MTLQWQKLPYRRAGEFADTEEGRWLIRKPIGRPMSRAWILLLNNERMGESLDLEALKKLAERLQQPPSSGRRKAHVI